MVERHKKVYPFKIIYPFQNDLFRPDYPFGSVTDKRINGAVDISSNLSINDLDGILKKLALHSLQMGGRVLLVLIVLVWYNLP